MKTTAGRAMMMKSSTKSAFSIALIMIVAAALYNWILSPHVGYLHAVQRYEPVVDEMARETGLLHKTLDKKRRRLRAQQQELARVYATLFPAADAKAFLGSLEPFVGQAGCKVVAVDFTSPTESENRGKPPRESKDSAPATASHVNLTITGSYDQILMLLDRLQTHSRKIWVDTCSLKLSDLRSGRLECRLSLTLYALSEKEGPSHE